MVLSKESEEFIINLRMYLMTSGKKESEITEIADELRGHLEDAESRGKNLDSVTGGSPKIYMENISNEMKTDFYGIVKLAPMFVLLLIAYFITGSAVRGDLTFSLLKLIAFPLIAVVSITVYVYTFRKMATKTWSTKKEMTIFFGIQAVTITLMAAVLFFDIFYFEPFYTPSRQIDWIIAAVGIFVFILSAILEGTWITIFIPLFLFTPDFIMQFIDVGLEGQLIINSLSLFALFAVLLIYSYMSNKKQNPRQS